MANTVIQLKYSDTTTAPTTLNVGEPAYSNTAGKLYIGANSNGTFGVYTIGGSYYTALVDAATDANTISTIVKRDADGIFSATAVKASLFGNANTASAWYTSRIIGVSGDANGTVSIDGSANANIPLVLGDTTVNAGTYGSASQAVTIIVDSKGRLTNVTTNAISSTLNIKGDTGTDAVSLGSNTITFVGGDGINTAVYSANSNVRFDVDNTVMRTTGGTISGDLSITGNLIITGNTITQDVQNIITEDSLIKLAANNAGDILDIGFYGQYVSSGTKYTGLVRQAAGNYFLFKGLTTDPTSNTLDPGSLTTSNAATLYANLTGGTVSSLASAIGISDGGTGATSFSASQLTIYNGTSLASLANTGSAGTYANAAYVPVITTDAYGRVSAVTNTAIAIDTSQITSGTLGVVRGGTGIASYAVGDIVYASGTTTLSTLADVATGNVLISGGVTTAPSWGKVSLTTHVSGTLPVANGGTGATSFTANGVIFGGLTSTSALSSVASSTEGHILQINTSGIPTFGYLSGGTF